MITQDAGLLHLLEHDVTFPFSSFSSQVPCMYLILSKGVMNGRKSRTLVESEKTEPPYTSRLRKQINENQRTQTPVG